jgi:hypothetical protein
MRSKYLDLALILIMSYFAITKFADGEIGFGLFFTVLSLLNILTLVMKMNRVKSVKKDIR